MATVLTANEMMCKGLDLAGFDHRQQARVQRSTNLDRFSNYYGSLPLVYAQIWEDLQTTPNLEARIGRHVAVDHFLMSLNWLKRYQPEIVRMGMFKLSEVTIRKWSKYFAMKLQALKKQKIIWPDHWEQGNDDSPTFAFSIDGVHCRIHEPQDPIMSKNPKYYSHKFNQAALNYEIAISVFDNQVLWVNGPTPAAVHDITVFRESLLAKIPQGKRGIADNGYRGEKGVLSTPNSYDPKELSDFKSRARSRHESFNARIKQFKCLDTNFRHGIDLHKVVFEAVVVICQYQLENGSPLFDV